MSLLLGPETGILMGRNKIDRRRDQRPGHGQRKGTSLTDANSSTPRWLLRQGTDGSWHCTGCGVSKPPSEYIRDRTQPNGLKHRCRECMGKPSAVELEHEKARRLAEKEARWVYSRHRYVYDDKGACIARTCKGCGELKSVAEFTKNSASPCGYGVRCRACHNERLIEKYESDSVYRAQKLEMNRRRYLRRRGAPGWHSDSQWQRLCEKARHRCIHCGDPDSVLTRDHIIPISQGGSDFIENIQPLCFRCNAKKNDRPDPHISEYVLPLNYESELTR